MLDKRRLRSYKNWPLPNSANTHRAERLALAKKCQNLVRTWRNQLVNVSPR